MPFNDGSVNDAMDRPDCITQDHFENGCPDYGGLPVVCPD